MLAGEPFGKSGPYERIVAKAHFAVDPKLPQNSTIRDLNLAPRNEADLVEFTADIYVLKPRDPSKGNGTALLEVSNRGGKGLLSSFNLAAGSADPKTEAHFGDGLLLEEGYTLVWVGWQWDVPRREGLMRLDAPIATENGKPIRGLVRSEFVPEALAKIMHLADGDHVAYPALQDAPSTLTVRESPGGRRTTIPAAQWKFDAARTAIEMQSGFHPGRQYELVYTAENPRVAGLGLVAVRDFIAFLKYGGDGLSVLGDQRRFIKRALGFGVSQSGRCLRTFLYYGLNEDEKGRKVFDGVWADVAGAGRGSFNHRFAQASRSGYPHSDTPYPTDLFPFSDVPQFDPATGESEGLLTVREAAMPKIFYTNTSLEYWSRSAALIHTSPDGELDAPLPPQTRLYVVSAAQHSPSAEASKRESAQFPTAPNDFRPLHRALLSALHEWVRDGKAPPASQYPLIAEKQLVPLSGLKFPHIPGVAIPQRPKRAYPLDFGPQFKDSGIISIEPPRVGRPYALLVPQVDDDGMDLAGVRMPVMRVPLGTATGWNYNTPSAGLPGQLAKASRIVVPSGSHQSTTRGIQGPSSVYRGTLPSRDAYLERVRQAADSLVSQRLLLARDVGFVLGQAGHLWDSTAQR